MSDEPRPAVATPAGIDFPRGRVLILLSIVLVLSVAVMAADMLGYMPRPA